MNTRLGRLCALAVACAGMLMAISAPVASATEPCSNIKGSGSSLQNIAQNTVWIPEFTMEGGGYTASCNAKPTIKYKATSTGTGEGEWGSATGSLGTEVSFPAYVGGDVAPEGPAEGAEAESKKTQLFEMDKAGQKKAGEPNKVMAVPVAQSAISVIVSLPVGCTPGEPSAEPTIENKPLEKEWSEEKTKLTALIGAISITGSACEAVPQLQAREKASGTTAGFKRFLNKISVADGKNRWKTFVETAAKAENTEWPSTPTKAGDGTGGELANHVYEEPDQMGYADLADAVAQKFTLTPEKHENSKKEKYYSFIAKIQNNGVSATPTYASPASGTTLTKDSSNCAAAEYSEPTLVGPNEDWSKAEQSNWEAGTTYPICTLTFDMAWQHYESGELKAKYSENVEEPASSGIKFNSSPKEVAQTVKDYLEWIVTKGQSTKLEEKQYGKLSSAIKTKAENGVKKAGNIGT